ncbi:hypothetical protein J6590_020877 [Homalodisca vitripennis]|nr:hypothetical protein J6590_020877 [Homalodisca vitripennis]
MIQSQGEWCGIYKLSSGGLKQSEPLQSVQHGECGVNTLSCIQPSEHLGGQRFSTDDEVKEEVTRFLKGLEAEFNNMRIEKLEHRLQKCLDKNGDYVEK